MSIVAKNIAKRAISNALLGTDAPKHKYTFEDFRQDPVACLRGGAAAAGATGSRNLLSFGINHFEQHVKGAGQTIIVPVLTDVGLDIGQDQTATEGIELTQGNLERGEHAYTIGTHGPFKLRVKAKIEDASGCNPFIIGFRKVQAYQAAHTSYTDFASIGIQATDTENKIKTRTLLNNAGGVTTDTLLTWADAAIKELEVRVDGKGQVTYKVNGQRPTVTVAYTFDTGDVVIPFLYFLHGADVAGKVELIEWECGLENEA